MGFQSGLDPSLLLAAGPAGQARWELAWLARVCFWPQADVTWERRCDRFQGESGHDADWLSLPSLTPERTLIDVWVLPSQYLVSWL